MEPTYLTREDDDLVALVGCTLDRSPKSNWVEDSGGLPEYICRIARAIHRSGRPISQAISIAVSRVKKWAAGLDDVDADTRAKAAKAVAQWEALKAKNKVKKGAKRAARAAKGDGNVGKRDTRVDLANVLLAAGPLQTKRVSDLDTILQLAAGKPNPFAKKDGDTKKPNPFAKGGDSGDKQAPPFAKKGDGAKKDSGAGLSSAAAVQAAWKRLQANKNLTPEAYAAQASKIKAAAKKFNVKLG